MAACLYSDKEQKILQDMVSILEDKNSTIQDQINAVEHVQAEIDETMFDKQHKELLDQNRVIKMNSVKDGLSKITLTEDEKNFIKDSTFKALNNIQGIENKIKILNKKGDIDSKNEVDELLDAIEKQNKRIEKLKSGSKQIIMMDGKPYLIITGKEKIRAIDIETNDVIITMKKDSMNTDSYKTLQRDIKQKLSNQIIKDADKGKLGKLSLPERIIQLIRKANKIVDIDGNLAKIRTFFKAKDKENLSIFAKENKPFTSINEKNKNNTAAYSNLVSKIPKHIRDIIIGTTGEFDANDNPIATESAVELLKNIPYMIKVMNDIVVPTEQVRKINYGIREDGTFGLQNQNTKYVDPNYLQLLGQFRERTANGETYNELVLDPAVEEIIKFYSVKAISDIEDIASKISRKNNSEIAKDFGISIEEASELKNKYLSNGSIPASSVIGSSAKDALNQIGLTVNSNIDMKIKSGLEASIDALIRGTLVNEENTRQYVTNESEKKDLTDLKEAIRTEIIVKGGSDTEEKRKKNKENIAKAFQELENRENVTFGNKTFMFLKINENAFILSDEDKANNNYDETVTEEKEATTGDGRAVIVNTFKNNVIKAINKMQYIAEGVDRDIPSAVPGVMPSKTMIKTNYPISSKNYKFLEDQNNIKWTFKDDLKDFLDLYKNPETRDLALQEAGYVTIDNTQHDDEKNRIISINDKIIRDIDTLKGYSENAILKDGFYLPWGQNKSGRPSLVTDLNPQESKLIRSYIQQDGHISVLSKKDFGKKSKDSAVLNTLEAAIAQALDLDPDKNSEITTMRNVRDIVNIHGAGSEVFTFGKFDPELNEFVADGFASTIKKLVTDKNEDGSKLTPMQRGVLNEQVFNEGEGNHGTQAVRALKRLYDWKMNKMKGEFTNDLTLETDAITSGMMLTLMEIMDQTSIDFLAKGGIYTKETMDKWTPYVKEMLSLKFKRDGHPEDIDKIVFNPGSLIEAGNYHALMIDPSSKIDSPSTTEMTKKLKKEYEGEIFNDLYKTVGVSMADTVNAQRDTLNSTLNNLKNEVSILNNEVDRLSPDDYEYNSAKISRDIKLKELRRTRVAVSLLNSIGKIDAKTLRNIAKFPVMYYIYGATVKSIKKNLTFSVAKEQLVKDIKSWYELETEAKELNTIAKTRNLTEEEMARIPDLSAEREEKKEYVKAVIDTYENNGNFTKKVRYYKYDDENRKIEMSEEEVSNMGEAEKLMHIDINEDMIAVIDNATNMTFGAAIEKGFKENFPMVDEYRESIKGIELVTFELFNAALESKVKHSMDKGYMTRQEYDKVMDVLIKSGRGHNMPTGSPELNDGNLLPLEKTDNAGSEDRASIVYKYDKRLYEEGTISEEEFKNRQYRFSAGLDSTNQIANTGASSTTSIHQKDGRLIVAGIGGEAWLSIYDAIVQASHPSNVAKSTTGYNTATITESSERSILHDNMNKLSFMFDDLNQRIADGDKDGPLELEMIRDRFARVGEENYEYSDGWEAWTNTGYGKKTDNLHKTMYPSGVGKEIKFDTEQKMLKDTVTHTVGNKTIVKESYYAPRRKEKGVLQDKRITKYAVKTTENGITEIEEHFMLTLSKSKEEFEKTGGKKTYNVDTIFNFKVAEGTEPDRNGKFPSKIVKKLKDGEYLTDTIHESKNFSGYAVSQSGADLQNDMRRTGLPLEVTIERLTSLNNRMKNRRKNLDQKFWSGHSWISYVDLTEVDNKQLNLKENNNDTETVSNFLKDMFSDGRKKEKEYLLQEYRKLYVEVKKDAPGVAKNIIKDANKIKFADSLIGNKNGSIEIIAEGEYGGVDDKEGYKANTPRWKKSSTKNYQEIAREINRVNNLGFTKDSVIVLSANGKSKKGVRTRRNPIINGELRGGYTSIDLGIAAGSTFIADTVGHINNTGGLNLLKSRGYEYTTDANEIRKFTGKRVLDKSGKPRSSATGEALYKDGAYNIGEIQLRNYLLQNGYTYSTEKDTNGNSFGVYKPISSNFKNIMDFISKRGC